MIQFLTFIVDSINTAIQFVHMLIQNSVDIILMLPVFTTYTAGLFAWLPQPFFLFCSLGFSIALILFLIGRQT